MPCSTHAKVGQVNMKSKSFTFSTLFYPPSGLSSRQYIVAAYILTVYVVDIEVKTDKQNNTVITELMTVWERIQ